VRRWPHLDEDEVLVVVRTHYAVTDEHGNFAQGLIPPGRMATRAMCCGSRLLIVWFLQIGIDNE
jgi:hypothetical protein